MFSKNVTITSLQTVKAISAVIVCALFFVIFTTVACAATWQCASCSDCQTKINSADAGDTIQLKKDIWDAADLTLVSSFYVCLNFNNKQNLIFDCARSISEKYVMDGRSNGYGIYLQNGSHNLTFKNCYITGFYSGIYGINVNSIKLDNIEVVSNDNYGVYLDTTSNNILNNVIANYNVNNGINIINSTGNNVLANIGANHNNYGIQFSSCGIGNSLNNIAVQTNSSSGVYFYKSKGTLDSVTAKGNNKGIEVNMVDSSIFNNVSALSNTQYGLYFSNSGPECEIKNSVIKWNALKDVYLNSESFNNNFHDNDFDMAAKIQDNGNGTTWDKNFVGNHWDAFDGLSDTCVDGGSGICTSVYPIDVDSVDKFPKHIGSVNNLYCNTCADCSDKAQAVAAGTAIYTASSFSASINCINLSGKTNLTFDCLDNAITGNGAVNGIYLNNGGSEGLNIVKNCVLNNFIIGLYSVNSDKNFFINNDIRQNTININLTNSTSTVIYANELLSKSKIFLDAVSKDNKWDDQLNRGNHWINYDKESDGCFDSSPSDGRCDSPYEIVAAGEPDERPKDNYSEYNGYNPYFCDSCDDCNAKITVAASGDVIKLTKNILNHSGTCIQINNKQNLTFDCQDYGIDGINDSDSYGIHLTGSGAADNNTVRNCYVTNFYYGVYAENTNKNNYINVSSNSNRYYSYTNVGVGFYMSNSGENTYNTVTANYNYEYGIYIKNGSGKNHFTGITANENARGLYFYANSTSTLDNLTLNDNSDYGLFFYKSNSNIASNLTAKYNKIGLNFTLSGDNTVRNSSGINSDKTAIEVISDNKQGNIFYDNTFISRHKMIDISDLTRWDNGLAGNWWQAYDTNDEGCVNNGSGICNSFYNIGTVTKDRYPVWKKFSDNVIHCTDCASCNNAIVAAQYGDTIYLDKHIFGAVGDCLNFSYKDGVTFNGGDYYIQTSNSDYKGIQMINYSEDNIIKNIYLSGFDKGIYTADERYNYFLSSVHLNFNSYGMYLDVNSSSSIISLSASNNNYGIFFADNGYSYYNNIVEAIVDNSQNNGIYFGHYAKYNTLASTTIKTSGTDIKLLSSAVGNYLFNNELTSKTKIDEAFSGSNFWDVGGKGNHWEAFDDNSEGCVNDGTGICVDDYSINSSSLDHFPKYKGGFDTVTCSTCADCNAKIAQAQFGDIVQLTQSIFNVLATCITINNKQGVTFDCQDNIISGPSGGSTGYGINIKGGGQDDYNTIKRCKLTEFSRGVVINNSNFNYLIDVDSNNNHLVGSSGEGEGFHITSKSNVLINVSAENNPKYGIYIAGDNNKMEGLALSGDGTGLLIYSGSNIVASSSTKVKANAINIQINEGVSDAMFYNNQFTSKEKIVDNSGSTHWNFWNGFNQAPGNQWEIYDTVIEGCFNNGGYCASPYWKDNFPKYFGTVVNRTCDSCDNCNIQIKNALYGEEVKLTRDITGIFDKCINLNYKEGVTFNCDNKSLIGTGPGSASKTGISINGSGKENNKIFNCKVSYLGHGLVIKKSGNNFVENSSFNINQCDTSSSCYGAGINISGAESSNNNFYNVETNLNEQGVYLSDGSFNQFVQFTASKNSQYGFYLTKSSSNSFTEITAENNVSVANNKGSGFYFDDSALDNTATSSFIKYNDIDVNISGTGPTGNIFYNNEFTARDRIIDKGTNSHWNNWSGDNFAPGNHWELFDAADECYNDNGISRCCTGAGLYCANVYNIDYGGSGDGGVSVDNFPLRNGGAAQTYYCDSCQDCSSKLLTASSGDIIKLTNDISSYYSDCLYLNYLNGVTLDCQNYSINGNKTSNVGIYLVLSNGNIIKNCEIINFDYNINLDNSNLNLIYNSILSNGFSNNVFLFKSKFNTFSNVTVNGGGKGFFIERADSNTFKNVTIKNSTFDGMWFFSSSNSVLFYLTVVNNGGYGVYLFGNNNTMASSTIKWNALPDVYIDGSNNTLYNNQLISKAKVKDDSNSAWNNGKEGNLWEAYDGIGDGCVDNILPKDGICDSPYVIDSNSIDNFPKYIGSVAQQYCNKTCADCQIKINGAKAGDTVYLTSAITTAGNCLDLSGKQNLTFNCQNNTIMGNAAAGSIGIKISNGGAAGNNTILYCGVTSFNKGISIQNSGNNAVASSTIKGNIGKDVEITVGTNNIFYGNEFYHENKMADLAANTTHWNNWNGADIVQGNHWEMHDEPLESCINNNGFCDGGYTIISSAAKDNYAEYSGELCNTCAECNTKIAAAGVGSTVKLAQDIADQSGSCITFKAKDGVTFDCQNFTIDGNEAGNGSYGIFLTNNTINSFVKNCRVSGFYYGIYLNSSNNNTIESSSAEYNYYNGGFGNEHGYGIYFNNSGSNTLNHVKVKNNVLYGVYMKNSNNNTLDTVEIINNNKFNDNYGLYFDASKNNKIKNSEIKWQQNNIYLNGTSVGNIFNNNHLISKEKITDTQGNGTQWNGNWWEAFDIETEFYVDGVTKQCTDNNHDNLCDDAYKITTGVYDNFPSYQGEVVNQQNKTCGSCEECGAMLQSAHYGEKIVLLKDIAGLSGVCINYGVYREGLTFDGGNHIIDGGGVYMHGYGTENNTFQNCTLLRDGFRDDDSSDLILNNITASYTVEDGLYLNNVSNGIYSNITANYNSDDGIYMYGGKAQFNNLELHNNISRGFNAVNVNAQTTIANATSTQNQYGLYFNWSNKFRITESFVQQNVTDIYIDSLTKNTKLWQNKFTSADRINDSGEVSAWYVGTVGNWWEAFDTDEEYYLDGATTKYCTDTDHNNICDKAYKIRTGFYDNYSVYKGGGANQQNITCNSCYDCSNKIQNAFAGEKVMLDRDINSVGNYCVDFGANKQNITFSCDAKTINSAGGGTAVFIHGSGSGNNIVEHCNLINFSKSVDIEDLASNIIRFIKVSSQNQIDGHGIHIVNSKKNQLRDIIATYNYSAIYLTGATDNRIGPNISLYNNTTGIDLVSWSNNNRIEGVDIQYPMKTDSCSSGDWGYGLNFQSSSNNIIDGNVIKNHAVDVNLNSNSNNNKFINNQFIATTSRINDLSVNIWSDGATGSGQGNTWEAFDSDFDYYYDGIDKYCTDNNHNNICDNVYPIKSGVFDNSPKYVGIAETDYHCTSCADCNNKIFNAKSGDTIYLDNDIFNQIGDCVKIFYKYDITFTSNATCFGGECIIDGDGQDSDSGITMCGTAGDATTVKNFYLITDFNIGINLNVSGSNVIKNLSANNNKENGVYIFGSTYNHLENINADYNSSKITSGVYLRSSNSNILNIITANYNTAKGACSTNFHCGGGLLLLNSSYNSLTNITTNDNYTTYSGSGVNLNGSHYNMVQNVVANNNEVGSNSWYGINGGGGIYLESSDQNIFYNPLTKNNTINSDGKGGGIYVYSSKYNSFYFVTLADNYKSGIVFDSASNNIVASGTMENNADKYIDIKSGSNNIFYGNELKSKDFVSDYGGSTHWNRWDGLDQMPGNHWEYYDTDPDIDGNCTDVVAPFGYCDLPYVVNTPKQDNYPIRPSVIPGDFSFSNASVNACNIGLNWTASNDAEKYIISRSDDGGSNFNDMNIVPVLGESAISYADNSLDSSKVYQYKIRSVNGSNSKQGICDKDLGGGIINDFCSDDDGFTTILFHPTICQSILSLTRDCAGSGKVALKWTDTDANNYYISRSNDGGVSYDFACNDESFKNNCGGNLYSMLDDDSVLYNYTDTSAQKVKEYQYIIRSCIGDCSSCIEDSSCECQATLAGRNDCYVKSNVQTAAFCGSTVLTPIWKEVRP